MMLTEYVTQIVLATCHSAGGRQLRDHIFDAVIIDEATQAVEAVCLSKHRLFLTTQLLVF